MKRFVFGLLLAVMMLPALGKGGTAKAVRETAESSTLVTGVIVVDEQGNVASFQLDQPEKLTPVIVDFVNSAARQWQFEPQIHDGKPVRVRNKVGMRLVARKKEEGSFTVRINGVDFQPYTEPESEMGTRNRKRVLGAEELAKIPRDRPVVIRRTPVDYPMGAAMAGAHGTAYIAVKISPDGTIADAVATKVNLGVAGNEKQMEMLRKQFADAAIRGIKKWRVAYPTEGEDANEPYVSGQITVEFLMQGMKSPAYGEWRAYIPGPDVVIPWFDPDSESPSFSPDAVAGDDFSPMDEKGKLKLLTPLTST